MQNCVKQVYPAEQMDRLIAMSNTEISDLRAVIALYLWRYVRHWPGVEHGHEINFLERVEDNIATAAKEAIAGTT